MCAFFIDPSELSQDSSGLLQVVFLGAVYGYVLFNASNMISDGSELLLLVPSLAGIVGSIVLPILGAVPDGMIVLFSGMGPDANKQLSVGVGALAGSTIMLLTIPWAISVYAGRVNLDANGRGLYKRPRNAPENWCKLSPPNNKSLWGTGIVLLDEIRMNAKTMVATSLIYLVLQIPASIYMSLHRKNAMQDGESVSTAEHPFTLITLIICLVAFVMYMYWNVKQSFSSKVADEIKGEVAVEAIRSSRATLSGILAAEASKWHHHVPTPSSPINSRAHSHTLEDIMRPFFVKYDTNHDKKIDIDELRMFFMDMNERLTREELETWMKRADDDGSGYIEFSELVEATRKYLIAKYEAEQRGKTYQMKHIHIQSNETQSPLAIRPDEDFDDEEEEEEVPQDLAHLSINEQQRRIKMRAAYLMLLGTALVLIFADPMVDILSDLGTRTGIPAFYISFVIAPLASNASELIAAYNYATKKTSKSVSISMSALLGAACMNNTFCLGIFAALMFFKRGLIWAFTAETCSILFVQLCMGAIAMRKTQRLADALLVLSLYPISIAIVAVLQSVFGLD